MWSDAVDAILGGDQAVALALRTPAGGVTLTPLTNFALRDRDAGTLSALNSSVGLWRKLARVRDDPRLAVAYHSRAHSATDRPEYVLVQGTASLAPLDPKAIRAEWERAAGPIDTGVWGRWMRVYYDRVALVVDVERIVVWPDLMCLGEPEVVGSALPEDPPPQAPPKKGTGPRIDHRRAARRAASLPHVLAGWTGSDGFPVVVPVHAGAASDAGFAVTAPAGLPAGGRRAGLLAHRFERYAIGQEQRIHTGWLQDGVYAPHTESGYLLPESKLLFRLGSGVVTRRGYREASKAGTLVRP